MALKWKSMRLSMAGSVTCPPSWKRSHRSPSLCILMPIFNRTVRSQIRETRVFPLKAPEKWCELWTFTLSKPSKYWLMNFHVWMKCSIKTLCVFPVSRWKRKTHTKDRFYADFKKNSHLFTHEGDGVVYTAVDDLSSSPYSDTQRSIIPHTPSDPLPCLKHHHL